MLHHHRDQLGVDLAEDAPRLGAAPFVYQAILLPQLEQQLDLPAHPGQHQHLLGLQQRRWRIGDEDGSIGLLQPPAPAGGHRGGDPRDHQADRQVLLVTDPDGEVEPDLELVPEPAPQLHPLPRVQEDGGVNRQTREKETARCRQGLQGLQTEVAPVGQIQSARWHRGQAEGGVPVIGARWLRHRPRQPPGAKIPAHLQLEARAGRGGVRTARGLATGSAWIIWINCCSVAAGSASQPKTKVCTKPAPVSLVRRGTQPVCRATVSAVVVKRVRIVRATCGMVVIGEAPGCGCAADYPHDARNASPFSLA